MEAIVSVKTSVIGRRMRYEIELEKGRKIVVWDSDLNYESPKVGDKVEIEEGKIRLVRG